MLQKYYYNGLLWRWKVYHLEDDRIRYMILFYFSAIIIK